MSENKGGRGIKAKYPTKTMRVPEILEKVVIKLTTAIYSDIGLENLESRLELDIEQDKSKQQLSLILPDKQELLETANKILSQKKSAKVSLEKLLQVIYSDSSLKL